MLVVLVLVLVVVAGGVAGPSFSASGGTKQTGVSTPDGTYTIHTFLSDQQFVIQTADPDKTLDILIVGGGSPGNGPAGQIASGAGGGGVVLS